MSSIKPKRLFRSGKGGQKLQVLSGKIWEFLGELSLYITDMLVARYGTLTSKRSIFHQLANVLQRAKKSHKWVLREFESLLLRH